MKIACLNSHTQKEHGVSKKGTVWSLFLVRGTLCPLKDAAHVLRWNICLPCQLVLKLRATLGKARA